MRREPNIKTWLPSMFAYPLVTNIISMMYLTHQEPNVKTILPLPMTLARLVTLIRKNIHQIDYQHWEPNIKMIQSLIACLVTVIRMIWHRIHLDLTLRELNVKRYCCIRWLRLVPYQNEHSSNLIHISIRSRTEWFDIEFIWISRIESWSFIPQLHTRRQILLENWDNLRLLFVFFGGASCHLWNCEDEKKSENKRKSKIEKFSKFYQNCGMVYYGSSTTKPMGLWEPKCIWTTFRPFAHRLLLKAPTYLTRRYCTGGHTVIKYLPISIQIDLTFEILIHVCE